VDEAIAELERVAARHWRGTEEERLGAWLLRAADGFTGRANSALAVGDPGMPLDDALGAVEDWYRRRGLLPMVAVPVPLDRPAVPGGAATGCRLDDQLSERSWPTREGPAFVMVAGVADGAERALRPGVELQLDASPDQGWLGLYHYRGQELPAVAQHLLVSAPWQVFASIRDRDGEALAIARLSIGHGWAGITAVEVAPSRRRQGLGAAITWAVCAQAAARGVKRVFLQVETGNRAALALYERCGFRYSHRYHYRISPRLRG
jgi:ribosomal protein S18 acetylase RimI-like enzyme